jgi:hypothetical protein
MRAYIHTCTHVLTNRVIKGLNILSWFLCWWLMNELGAHM